MKGYIIAVVALIVAFVSLFWYIENQKDVIVTLEKTILEQNAEVYSIISNIYTIKSGEELPEYDAIAIIDKKLRNVLMRIGE